jgi:Skp family chaperone for outer membrane proteins
MSGEILDLRPRIVLKQQRDCDHEHMSVGMETAEVSCDDCGAPLDPWWALRELASRHQDVEVRIEAMRAHYAAEEQRIQDELAKVVEAADATIARHQADIAALLETKKRLHNEQINGRPLGEQRNLRRPAERFR